MSEEQKPSDSQDPMASDDPSRADGGPNAQTKSTSGEDLIDALTELGDKFAEIVHEAWNSEQRKQIETDLRAGIVSLADSLEESFKRVSQSDEGREIRQRAEGVAESVTEGVRRSEVVQSLAEGLMLGLKEIGDSLGNLSEEVKSRNAARKSAAANASTPPPATDSTAADSTGAHSRVEDDLPKDDEGQDIPVSPS
ncbi:MAG: hypothetical protein HC802_14400 [Caldilineaceae bacterium]|nr:hypothetical protein [Caldilineaceae bacterium]